MSDNLLAPLEFDDGYIDQFIQRNACALCLGHLVKYPAPNGARRWIARCPEHGPVNQTAYVKKGRAQRVTQDILIGLRELR